MRSCCGLPRVNTGGQMFINTICSLRRLAGTSKPSLVSETNLQERLWEYVTLGEDFCFLFKAVEMKHRHNDCDKSHKTGNSKLHLTPTGSLRYNPRLLGESEKVSLPYLPFYAINSHFCLLYQYALKITGRHFPDRFRSQKDIPIFSFERLWLPAALQSPHEIPPLGMPLHRPPHTHTSLLTSYF